MANKEVVICSPMRTAIGTYGGTLKDMAAVDLGAVAISVQRLSARNCLPAMSAQSSWAT